jgi:15-cis-phytoene synthase
VTGFDAAGSAGEIHRGLAAVAARARAVGMPAPEPSGQLIRPSIAHSAFPMVAHDATVAARFWCGAQAIQLAHEASLVHDDVVDGTATRRGAPTVAASAGVAAALVLGDHLLTAAYRVAAWTGSAPFMTCFAEAVERTVAGEVLQARRAGRVLCWEEYEEVVLGKSGELMGAALALGPLLAGRDDAAEFHVLGRRVGLVYQMLDDLLDYCPATDTGKPALGDYTQRHWTWPLAELGVRDFDGTAESVAAALHAPDRGGSAARRCLSRLRAEAAAVRAGLVARLGDDAAAVSLLDTWVARAEQAVAAEAAARSRAAATGAGVARAALLARLPEAAHHTAFMARHSRSFRFAARFFSGADAERVARVYAYCRLTDDIVDLPNPAVPVEAMLDEWLALSRRAYDGEATGVALLDAVMREMSSAEVPFALAEELAAGMRMDLERTRYASLDELRTYTYRVASVVGLWVSRLFGVRDPAVLERAVRMGHAMQLTNILRDVGEDWRRGRLYLPADWLARFGVDEEMIEGLTRGTRPVTAEYRKLVEALLVVAETDYAAGFDAIPALPAALQRPVAVAAYVYRGIHRGIRRAGHDNLRRRAFSTTPAKLWLATCAVAELWMLNRGLRRRPMQLALRAEGGATARRLESLKIRRDDVLLDAAAPALPARAVRSG